MGCCEARELEKSLDSEIFKTKNHLSIAQQSQSLKIGSFDSLNDVKAIDILKYTLELEKKILGFQ